MTTLSGYVLRLTLAPLLAILSITLVALLTERMLHLLDVVLSSSGSLQPLMELLSSLIPHYMAVALPLAFFLSVLLVITGLHQRSELDVIAAAGVGMTSIMRPIFALSLLLTAISALNVGWAQPYARYLYRALLHDVKDVVVNIMPQKDTFMEVSNVTFMAQGIDLSKDQFRKIFIYRKRDNGDVEAITASSGQLYQKPGAQDYLLVMTDGYHVEVQHPTGDVDPSDADAKVSKRPSSRVSRFERFQIPISFNPETGFRERGGDEREYTLAELWPNDDSKSIELPDVVVKSEFNDRVVRIISVLFLPFFAAGIAIGQRRAQRSHVIAVGLVLLILYSELLWYGRYYVSIGDLPSIVGQWLPLGVMAIVSVVLFYRAAFLVPRTWFLFDLIGRCDEALRLHFQHAAQYLRRRK